MGWKKELIKIVGTKVVEAAIKSGDKKHGSKVKDGAFKNCPIVMIGDEACIVVNESSGEIVSLTSEYVQSYEEYKKEQKRLVGVKVHTYYYYKITFRDGRKSYVRMRKKYRNAMKQYC